MDALIVSLLEKSLVGGAFIYMLHFFLTRVSQTLEEVARNLAGIVNTLADISDTMKQMDARITKLEDKT